MIMEVCPTNNQQITIQMPEKGQEVIESLLYEALELEYSVFKTLDDKDLLKQEKAALKKTKPIKKHKRKGSIGSESNSEQALLNQEYGREGEKCEKINMPDLYQLCKKTSASIESLSQCYYKMTENYEDKSETTCRDGNKIQSADVKNEKTENLIKIQKSDEGKKQKTGTNNQKTKKIQKGNKRKNEDFINKKIEKMVLGERLGTSRVLRKSEQKQKQVLTKSVEIVVKVENIEENQNFVSQIVEHRIQNSNSFQERLSEHSQLDQNEESGQIFPQKIMPFDPFQEDIPFEDNRNPLLDFYMDESYENHQDCIFSFEKKSSLEAGQEDNFLDEDPREQNLNGFRII